MAELKPCPFCGEKPIGFFDSSRLVALVKCTNWSCSVQPMTKCYTDKQQAIDAWNRRDK